MKHNIFKSLSLCLFILATAITAQAASADAPMTIKIDGNLNDAAWQHGRAIEGFRTFEGETPKAATTGMILTDANYLYLSFRCEEPEMDKLQQITKARDGSLWTNDCIEIFVAPYKDQKKFYHLIIDVNGDIYDAFKSDNDKPEDNKYDLDITAKTQKQKDAWTLEMAVPLSDLGLSTAREALMNFGRERKPVSELTSWHGLFAKPDTWQQVKLTLNKQRSVDVSDWDFGNGAPLYGDNTAKSTFVPNTASPLKVLLYAEQNNKWILKNSKEVKASPKATTQVSIPYTLLPRDQPQSVRLVIENNREAAFRATYKLNLPEKALVARLQTPYFYSTEQYGFVHLDNVISAASIKHASIRLLLKSPDGKLQQTKIVNTLQPSMTIGFNISGWQKGDGAIFVELLNNGKPLAHERLIVTKRPGPFSKSTF